MELRELAAFVAVADRHNFTRASGDLALTQPAVTRQVASLEQELKVRLFDRMGRRVELTAAGHVLYRYAADIVGLTNQARLAVLESAHGTSGPLAIGASSTAATYLLPEVLRQFAESHANVSLSLQTGPSRRVAELVAANDVDFGIVMDFENRASLTADVVGNFALVAVLYPGHPFAREGTGALDSTQLADIGLIVMQPGATLRRHVEQVFKEVGADLRITMETDNVETIKKMVQARLGVSILPEVAVRAEAAAGQLIVRRLDGIASGSQQISIIHRTDKYKSEAMRHFADLLSNPVAGFMT